jgi:hypothetical protein
LKVVLPNRLQFDLEGLSRRMSPLIWRTSILPAVRNEKPCRKDSGRVQTADKPVDFSAVFLFLGWTVTV